MEKKKKKLLIIIVSIVLSVMLIVGGVLGVVFGLRNKGGTNPPEPPPQNPEITNPPEDNPPSPPVDNPPDNPPNPPVDHSAEILRNQREFIGQFNATKTFESVQSVDTLNLVDSAGQPYTKYSSVSAFYDRGYIAKTSRVTSSKDFYVYRLNSEGIRCAVSLKQTIMSELTAGTQGVIMNLDAATILYHDGFLSYKYASNDTNLDVAYVDENGGVRVVNRIYTTYKNDKYEYKGQEYDSFDIIFSENCYLLNFYAADSLETSELSLCEVFAYDNTQGEVKNCYSMTGEDLNDVIYFTPFGLIIEKAEEAQVEAEPSSTTTAYTYKKFDFATGSLTDFALETGEAKLEFGAIYGTGYYYKIAHGRDAENNVEVGGKISYFDAKGDEVLSYDAKDSDDLIVAADNDHILTKSGILQLSGEVYLQFQFKLENFVVNGAAQKLAIHENLVLKNAFVAVDESGEKYLIDLGGNVVGEEYDDAYMCGETVILIKDSACFVYNSAQNAVVALPQGFDTEYSSLWAVGMYLVKTQNTLTIYNSAGEVVAENVSSIVFTKNSSDSNDPLTFVKAYTDAGTVEFWFRGYVDVDGDIIFA